MKKNKKHRTRDLIEAIGELLLTLLCFGIGIFIISLFGVDFESTNMDYDLIILLGLVSFFVIFGVVSAFVELLKKILREKCK